MLQDIAVRLGDMSEFAGVYALVPTSQAHVPQAFVKMGFQFVAPGVTVPDGVTAASPERHEVWLPLPGVPLQRLLGL